MEDVEEKELHFVIKGAEKSFIVKARNEAERTAWLTKLGTLIQEYRDREMMPDTKKQTGKAAKLLGAANKFAPLVRKVPRKKKWYQLGSASKCNNCKG